MCSPTACCSVRTARLRGVQVRRLRYPYADGRTAMPGQQSCLFDVPCVICQAAVNRDHSILIPGRTTCPAEYALDYRGYVMASSTSDRRAGFACVEERMERGQTNATLSTSDPVLGFVETGVPIGDGDTRWDEVACVHCLRTSGLTRRTSTGYMVCLDACLFSVFVDRKSVV